MRVGGRWGGRGGAGGEVEEEQEVRKRWVGGKLEVNSGLGGSY